MSLDSRVYGVVGISGRRTGRVPTGSVHRRTDLGKRGNLAGHLLGGVEFIAFCLYSDGGADGALLGLFIALLWLLFFLLRGDVHLSVASVGETDE